MCLMDLFQGVGEGEGPLKLHIQIGDHQKKKFYINNTVEALILFNEEHQNLLKLHVPLGWGGF